MRRAMARSGVVGAVSVVDFVEFSARSLSMALSKGAEPDGGARVSSGILAHDRSS
jgi:hypothetical protein